jgi:hypothetical protein
MSSVQASTLLQHAMITSEPEQKASLLALLTSMARGDCFATVGFIQKGGHRNDGSLTGECRYLQAALACNWFLVLSMSLHVG